MPNYVLRRRTPDGINTVNKVKEIQRKLGVETDGIWGPVTEAAYQISLKNTQQPLTMGGLRLAEQASRPKSITDYVTTYGGQGQRDWKDTELSDMGISNSNLRKIVNPEKLAQSDKALSKQYIQRSSNNKTNLPSYTIYPIDPDRTAGNTWLRYTSPIDGVSYVESARGNLEMNGKTYFPTNSKETVSYVPPFDTIDYDFQSKEFFERLYDALPEKYSGNLSLQDFMHALTQSRKGAMDQKRYLDENTLYLFNRKLYNRNEAGNIIWGAAMHKLGFNLANTLKYANQAAQLFDGRPDEEHDQRAIREGWNYISRLESTL